MLPAAVADLEVPWLVPDQAGGWRQARYCADCAPRGGVWSIECADCGDGPLLLLDEVLPGMPVGASARTVAGAFLAALGWTVRGDQELFCPAHRPAPALATSGGPDRP